VCCNKSAIYLIFELYEYDLKHFMSEKLNFSIINPVDGNMKIKKIMFQLISGLNYCQTFKVLHRDIKPQNILIDNNENIKIADFGLARSFNIVRPFTKEVVSLWYRAPEIILGCTQYSSKVDVWAVGCIFAELLSRKANLMEDYILFKGADEMDQLKKIFR